MSKQPPPAPTASAIGPCPTIIQIVGRPGTGSLPSTIAPPDHPSEENKGGLDRYSTQGDLNLPQLVKDLTSKKESRSTIVQDNNKYCLTEEREILSRWTEYCSEL